MTNEQYHAIRAVIVKAIQDGTWEVAIRLLEARGDGAHPEPMLPNAQSLAIDAMRKIREILGDDPKGAPYDDTTREWREMNRGMLARGH